MEDNWLIVGCLTSSGKYFNECSGQEQVHN